MKNANLKINGGETSVLPQLIRISIFSICIFHFSLFTFHFSISLRREVSSLLEQRHARREPVNEILPTDRPEFALGKKARQRDLSRLRTHGTGIVIGFSK